MTWDINEKTAELLSIVHGYAAEEVLVWIDGSDDDYDPNIASEFAEVSSFLINLEDLTAGKSGGVAADYVSAHPSTGPASRPGATMPPRPLKYNPDLGIMQEQSTKPTLASQGQLYISRTAAKTYQEFAELGTEEARRELTEILMEARPVEDKGDGKERWRYRRQSEHIDITALVSREDGLIVVTHISVRGYR